MLNDYGKKLFKPWCSVQNVLVVLSVIFLVALTIVHFSLNSSEIASWVQAIGSIAAIWGAFTVSNNQVKRQIEQKEEEKKRQAGALLAVVKSASDHTLALLDMIRQRPVLLVFGTFWNGIFSELFGMSVNSLKQIPAHELGDYDLVVNYVTITGCMVNIVARVKRWEEVGTINDDHAMILYRDLETQCSFVISSWEKFKVASEK
jgi:hypothetical protein